MKRYFLILIMFLGLVDLKAQVPEDKPKLIVGVVVDQMRYDYLSRFWNRFGEDGFKRLVAEGYNFKNHHYNYAPTFTAPGHASIYSGTSPMNHGIISNGWYEKFEDNWVYCVSDTAVDPVGSTFEAGKMSPHRMLSSTFADENRLFTQMKGKTIGIALKDRGAILPAGHTANAAYWFNGKGEASWITSSYYMNELPQWVKEFNASGKAESYLKTWNTLEDISTYVESGADENEHEFNFVGREKSTFPYDLKKLAKENSGAEIIKSTPFGNDLTMDFAKAAIKAENLGQDNITDVLTVSFSSTDYIGHKFGVNSKEAQDTYMRLDKNIADLLKYLDANVGKGEYTLFLTADHGGIDVPSYLASRKLPAGYVSEMNLNKHLMDFVKLEFGTEDVIKNISNFQVFLDYEVLKTTDLEADVVQEAIAQFLINQDHVSNVLTRAQLTSGSFTKGVEALIQNGFNQKRSGDVMFSYDPAYIPDGTGYIAAHGSPMNYDTHVPLLFFGKGIRQGATNRKTEIPDIAPTVSALLGISAPNATSGQPLIEVLE